MPGSGKFIREQELESRIQKASGQLLEMCMKLINLVREELTANKRTEDFCAVLSQ